MDRLGLLIDRKVVDLQEASAMQLTGQHGEPRPLEMADALVGHDLAGFLAGGDRALETARKTDEFSRKIISEGVSSYGGNLVVLDVKQLKLKKPLPNSYSVKVMCPGGNFGDHHAAVQSVNEGRKVTLEEGTAHILENPPWGFYKLGGNLIGDGDVIPYPARTKRLDYEGEVGIVIGRPGKDIPRSRYLDYVVGFTLFNDVSIRDGSSDRGSQMFTWNKNFDSCGSIGPCIVTKDEIPNPDDIEFKTVVSGELRQSGRVSGMARKYGEWVEYLSRDVVLHPGDIITSGTCAGTAADRTPKKDGVADAALFLKEGDTVEVSSPQIGVLTNRVVAKTSI
jgi:2-keto-4-pentenoate hydratase/2-oxohepta-3-ene-1,7-dioic acid hydratase in catechol pathway